MEHGGAPSGERSKQIVAVRRATPIDAAAIATVHVRAWKWAYEGLIPGEVLAGLSEERREAMWREMLSACNSGVVWVAERAGAVVGFSAWGPAREPRKAHVDAELYAIYQEHHALKTGVGSRLLAATVEDMRKARHRWAMLWVLETNELARGFYEHYGWHADGAIKRETVHGFELQEVRYSLAL